MTDPDADRTRTLAALLGRDPEDLEARGASADYDALPAADADEPTPTDVRFDPGVPDDAFDAFVSTFDFSTTDDGPLAGWDLAVKDNLAVAGVPLTAGSRVLADATPARHAPAVSRLLDAGARLVGKTNMDELAYGPTGETSAFGPTRNPQDTAHVAGGSSAGSGAAVAAGIADAALGTDTGGSVRIPAAFCGVVGYKPSFGTVPRTGVVPLAPSLDHVGVLANSVADAAHVADVVAGPDGRDSATVGREPPSLAAAATDARAIEDCSFGLAEEFLGEHVDPAVRGRVERAVDALEAAGARVEHVSVPRFDLTAPVWDAITNVELAAALFAGLAPLDGVGVDGAWHADAAEALRAVADGTADHAFADRLVENALDGAALLDEGGASVYTRALAECERFADGYADALGDHDALLAPTMPVTAPAVGEWPLSADDRDDRDDSDAERPPLSVNVRQANLLGAPALSLPCGRVGGLPVGLQLLGTPGADTRLVAAAAAVEAELR
ncbi:amidase [Halospeciosus flavus]|uniref:Amidase n=1 Tax=Halospeciosus flavus TaxID=3032283 RepID=A0ABD5Z0N8_9EURY|nr:amidase [Halospeciosus flavus]